MNNRNVKEDDGNNKVDDDDDDDYVDDYDEAENERDEYEQRYGQYWQESDEEGEEEEEAVDDVVMNRDDDDKKDEEKELLLPIQEDPINQQNFQPMAEPQQRKKQLTAKELIALKRERMEFDATLEHLVMVGNHARHVVWRRQEWQRRQQQQQQQQNKQQHKQQKWKPAQQTGSFKNSESGDDNDENFARDAADDDDDNLNNNNNNNAIIKNDNSDNNNNNNNNNNIPGRAERRLHAEDVRIYGRKGYPNKPWPPSLSDQSRQQALLANMHLLPPLDLEGGEIYSQQQNEWQRLQQRRQRQLANMDAAWDAELGDGINPLLFSDARLSLSKRQRRVGPMQSATTKTPSATISLQQHVPNMTTTSTATDTLTNATTANDPSKQITYQELSNCTVQLSDVPRALLLRCWERAVHAASCTIECPVTNTTATAATPTLASSTTATATKPAAATTSATTAFGSPLFESQSESATTNPEAALMAASFDKDTHMNHHQQPEQQQPLLPEPPPFVPMPSVVRPFSAYVGATKLGQLQIPLSNSDQPPFPCPSCPLTFDSLEQLDLHFFGTTNVGGGCAWQLIHRRQEQLIQQVLEQQVAIQTTSLIRIIFSYAQKEIIRQRQQEEQQQQGEDPSQQQQQQQQQGPGDGKTSNKDDTSSDKSAKDNDDDDDDDEAGEEEEEDIASESETDSDSSSSSTTSKSPNKPRSLSPSLPQRTWQDILGYVQSAMNDSTPLTPSPDFYMPRPADYLAASTTAVPTMPLPPTLLETLQTEPDRLPLILNRDLLTIVSERLVDRYADVPN